MAVRGPPQIKLLLMIEARNLLNKDVLSKSDPMCRVLQRLSLARSSSDSDYHEIGRTEVVMNNLNPVFATHIPIDYFFEERQFLRFELYDIDSNSPNLKDHDFLGVVNCELADIVGGGTYEKSIEGVKNGGTFIVTAHQVSESNERVHMDLALNGVKGGGSCCPFFQFKPFAELGAVGADGRSQLIHRTTASTSSRLGNFSFPNTMLKEAIERNKTLRFSVFDYFWNGSHKLIGTADLSPSNLLATSRHSLQLTKEPKTNLGLLEVRGVRVIKEHSFLDFIQGATQLDFAVAVDFTASNGAVTNPSSLHYIHPQRPNQYEIAIRAVIDICQAYNRTQLFDAFGFGAIVPPQTFVSPIFSLNFDQNPAVHGVMGILQSYRHSLERVQLYGPTNFAPVINEAAAKAAASDESNGTHYEILLIITDGVISDMANTKRSIIKASSLPLSIIIVGVGNAEFDSMDELDSDNRLLTFEGRTAVRDIVQFVPINQFLTPGVDPERAMALLAKAVLAEVPQQLTGYMKSRGIQPRPRDSSQRPNPPYPMDKPTLSEEGHPDIKPPVAGFTSNTNSVG